MKSITDWATFMDRHTNWLGVYSGQRVVVKFGGALAEDPVVVGGIARQVDFLRQLVNVSTVVVHGGGRQVDKDLEAAGIPVRRDSGTGLRITDTATLAVSDLSLRVLNSKITAQFNLSVRDITAIGFAGYDQQLVTAESCGNALGGYTGEKPTILGPGADFLDFMLRRDRAMITPIFYSICANRDHTMREFRLNVNADDMADAVASGVGASRLILCSDVPGVLDKDKKLISELSTDDVPKLIADGTISGGMIPKVQAAARAAEAIPQGGVVILDGRKPGAILEELLTDSGSGTLIRHRNSLASRTGSCSCV